MAVSLERFNRIIDITFITSTASKYDSRGFKLNHIADQRTIVCPRHGIKPNIEINGTYDESGMIHAFYITIKNLYLDLRTEQYSKIKVRAGYANRNITFEANIMNMYQQSPGPEGTTIVECMYGNITKTWFDATVQLDFKKGAKLTDVLNAIKTKLNATDIALGKKAMPLKLQEPLQFDGTAREAMAKVEQKFIGDKLKVFMRGDKLCAVCLTEGDCIEEHVLQYLSALPQQNPGDEEGNWTTQITAPWMPDLLPGDNLIIPLQTYVRYGQLVGGGKKLQKMHVIKMSFHFGTRGTVNQMTCEGYIVR